MRFRIEDVSFATAKRALESNGFAIVQTNDELGMPLTADVWTSINQAGVPYGFCCGRLSKEVGNIATFDLVMDDHFLRDDCEFAKDRFTKVVDELLHRVSIR